MGVGNEMLDNIMTAHAGEYYRSDANNIIAHRRQGRS